MDFISSFHYVNVKWNRPLSVLKFYSEENKQILLNSTNISSVSNQINVGAIMRIPRVSEIQASGLSRCMQERINFAKIVMFILRRTLVGVNR